MLKSWLARLIRSENQLWHMSIRGSQVEIIRSMQFLNAIPLSLQTVLLLIASNVFMTFAWYGHLKNMATAPWYFAALASWGIALFEYLLQVPGNRIGFQQAGFTVAQLKIMQEVITLSVFVPFAMVYLTGQC